MPIYEYECDSCGKRKEVIQKFSDPLLVDCPSCGEAALRKLVSAAGFRLKGSGWYETDFKNKPKPPADCPAGGDAKTSPCSSGACKAGGS